MLYVLVPSYPLTDYLFEGLDQEPGLRIIRHPFGKRGRLKALLRNVEAYLLWWLPHSWFYEAAHLAQLRQIEPDDAVLYFAIENRKDLAITHKFVRARKQSIWLWNPIRSYRKGALSRWLYKQWLHRAAVKAYTFDPLDAQSNGLQCVEQVFRQPAKLAGGPDIDVDIDVYFIGIDKGRLAELKQWMQVLGRQGLRTHFHIVADKRTSYAPQDLPLVTHTWMPYRDNLDVARRSRCLLELLQGTQSGPTMRSMEALFLGCKLITNNASIVDCGFYHPSRIFIIGRDRAEDLTAFLQLAMEPADKALLCKHEIGPWLRQFACDKPATIAPHGID